MSIYGLDYSPKMYRLKGKKIARVLVQKKNLKKFK